MPPNEMFDDLKERNSIARSARTAVGGKRKYMLGSDYLSPGELRRKNGEITVYEMKKPIGWAKFKGYPKDVQREYLQWFADEFHATTSMVAKVLGITSTYLSTELGRMGLSGILHRQPVQEGKNRFCEWLKQFEADEPVDEPVVPEKPKPKPVEQPTFFHTIQACEMSMEGKASEISQTLFNLFKDQRIAVTVVFAGATEVEDAKVD